MKTISDIIRESSNPQSKVFSELALIAAQKCRPDDDIKVITEQVFNAYIQAYDFLATEKREPSVYETRGTLSL